MHIIKILGFSTALLAILAGMQFTSPALAQQRPPSSRTQIKDNTGTEKSDTDEKEVYAFRLPNIDGKGELTFSELADSGKPFAIFLWRTDCPLCHMQMPYAQQLQRIIDEHDVDMRFISICLDDTSRDALAMIEEKGLTFTVLHDGHGRRIEDGFHAKEIGLPLTYLFKKNGVFVEYIGGFRAGYAKSVLQLLDLPLPAELKKR